MEASKNGFWCCMPLGWVPCGMCQKSPNRSWNSICTDRQGYACTRIHGFIYGREAIIETDHKPLSAIVNKPLRLCRSSTNAVLATELRFAKVENTIIFFKLSSGWCKPDFCVKVKPFFPLRYELIVDDGIILKGLIVVVRDPYARRMSSNYARDILEQMLQWKELGMLCIGPLWHRTLTLR